MKTVVLTKDFAGKKAGYEFTNIDSILCSKLVNTLKVAVYKEENKPNKRGRKPKNEKEQS